MFCKNAFLSFATIFKTVSLHVIKGLARQSPRKKKKQIRLMCSLKGDACGRSKNSWKTRRNSHSCEICSCFLSLFFLRHKTSHLLVVRDQATNKTQFKQQQQQTSLLYNNTITMSNFNVSNDQHVQTQMYSHPALHPAASAAPTAPANAAQRLLNQNKGKVQSV